MSGRIYLLNDNSDLMAMEEAPYDAEKTLQELLAKHADLLAGEQINSEEPRRWLLVTREMSVPGEEDGAARWSLDHLFLDQDAVPTLVEVKQSTNSDIRRKVVGQMLDYAANAVVYWPVEEIKAKFEARCAANDCDPTEELATLLGGESDPTDFWHRVKTNLQAGRIRMVFVSDSIPLELRRIVEFLNEQMDPAEVLAVEVKQYVGKGMQTLVPRVIGQTAEAEKRKGVIREERQWDEASFFTNLEERHGSSEAQVARKLLEWVKPRATRLWWGKGRKDGSVYALMDDDRGTQWLFALWTYGKVEIPFGSMRKNSPYSEEGKRKQLLDRLNQIRNVTLPDDSIERYPRIELSTLKDPAILDEFIQAMDWAAQQIELSR